jgi:hypothetical protein
MLAMNNTNPSRAAADTVINFAVCLLHCRFAFHFLGYANSNIYRVPQTSKYLKVAVFLLPIRAI